MALPQAIFVREETAPDGMTILVACLTAPEAVEADHQTLVGTYKLVGTRRLLLSPDLTVIDVTSLRDTISP